MAVSFEILLLDLLSIKLFTKILCSAFPWRIIVRPISVFIDRLSELFYEILTEKKVNVLLTSTWGI